MKTIEEIEQLADEKYLKKAEVINDPTLKDFILSATKGGYIDGYIQCQEDMADKKYTLNDMKKACACGIDICYKKGGNDFQPFEDLINSLNKQD